MVFSLNAYSVRVTRVQFMYAGPATILLKSVVILLCGVGQYALRKKSANFFRGALCKGLYSPHLVLHKRTLTSLKQESDLLIWGYGQKINQC